jgi:hypothetical protein
MNAKQMLCVLLACQLRKENDLMAEYMLLRMAMIGVIIGMFALTITARKMAHVAWHHLFQRKEPRV